MLEKMELLEKLEKGMSAICMWNEFARLCLHSFLKKKRGGGDFPRSGNGPVPKVSGSRGWAV